MNLWIFFETNHLHELSEQIPLDEVSVQHCNVLINCKLAKIYQKYITVNV